MGYPAAGFVASRIRDHFENHLAEARERGEEHLASAPDARAIETIVEAAFWASLRREEGYVPTISLAYLSPEESEHAVEFEQTIPLSPAALAKIAPAVERPGIHLGVWRKDNEFRVWGMVQRIPSLCFVLEVAGPGLLVVKHRRGDRFGKFVNVAVLEGDEVKIVDERAGEEPDCPAVLTSLLGLDSPSSWIDSVNVLVQLAVSMRAHGRGGTLLVVPGDGGTWRESVLMPISYAVTPAYGGLADVMRAEEDAADVRRWEDALSRAIDAVAGLTAVDGATVISIDYDLLAFGAKIVQRPGWEALERVRVSEPVVGGGGTVLLPPSLGGMRHLSAAQFAHDQRDALALVASQDGRFTVFAWSPCFQMVQAHRIESLLL